MVESLEEAAVEELRVLSRAPGVNQGGGGDSAANQLSDECLAIAPGHEAAECFVDHVAGGATPGVGLELGLQGPRGPAQPIDERVPLRVGRYGQRKPAFEAGLASRARIQALRRGSGRPIPSHRVTNEHFYGCGNRYNQRSR